MDVFTQAATAVRTIRTSTSSSGLPLATTSTSPTSLRSSTALVLPVVRRPAVVWRRTTSSTPSGPTTVTSTSVPGPPHQQLQPSRSLERFIHAQTPLSTTRCRLLVLQAQQLRVTFSLSFCRAARSHFNLYTRSFVRRCLSDDAVCRLVCCARTLVIQLLFVSPFFVTLFVPFTCIFLQSGLL